MLLSDWLLFFDKTIIALSGRHFEYFFTFSQNNYTCLRPSFRKTGLKVDSAVKLDKIATVLKDLIVGELGKVDEKPRKEVNQRLKRIMEI